jgi:hypothetical protein
VKGVTGNLLPISSVQSEFLRGLTWDSSQADKNSFILSISYEYCNYLPKILDIGMVVAF